MSLTPDGRRRMITDFGVQFKYGAKAQPVVPDWLAKVERITTETQTHAEQIAKAGGAVKPDDRQKLRETLFTLLLQKFDTFSKEELMFFSTTIIADRIMDEVESRSWGGTKPDALS